MTVEAMKMEHALSAPVEGVVELLVAVGDQVKVGQPLAKVTAGGAGESADAAVQANQQLQAVPAEVAAAGGAGKS